MNNCFKWIFIVIICVVYAVAVFYYQGNPYIYLMFTIVFTLLLIDSLVNIRNYGYLFLSVMLWLGFWLKITVHLLVDYPYGEPVGLFGDAAEEWDHVLLVACVGAIGVILANNLFCRLGFKSTDVLDYSLFSPPFWYVRYKKQVWIIFLLSCFIIAALNAYFGIQQSGLVPNVILPWPLNAVVYWLLGSGFALGVATLIWWDICLGRSISAVIYVVIFEAFVSSVSILSRGAYIFHAFPQMLAVFFNRFQINGWSIRRALIFIVIFILFLAIALPLVNTMRSFHYSNVKPVFSDFSLSGKAVEVSRHFQAFSRFAVDRWIGAEGVMSVSSFPDKKPELFLGALMEKGEVGKSTVYQDICLSHYRFMDMSKFQFASLPGAISFLYFSGSLLFVLVGMSSLTAFLLFSEKAVAVLTKNPILCALWGGTIANIIAQMGVAPRGLLIFMLEMIFAITFICFIQSKFLDEFMKKCLGKRYC